MRKWLRKMLQTSWKRLQNKTDTQRTRNQDWKKATKMGDVCESAKSELLTQSFKESPDVHPWDEAS